MIRVIGNGSRELVRRLLARRCSNVASRSRPALLHISMMLCSHADGDRGVGGEGRPATRR
jgi:hypothetical protein